MAKLTAEQVGTYAQQAGFAGGEVSTVVAIAECESGFRTDATNTKNANKTVDVGLMQINSVHLKAHPTWTQAWLKLPANNMAAARTLWAESGAKPWAPSQGCWRSKVGKGASFGDIPDIIGGIASDPLSVIPDPFEIVGQLVEPVLAAAKWIGNPGNWVRIVQVGGGVALGLVAASIVVKPIVQEAKGVIR